MQSQDLEVLSRLGAWLGDGETCHLCTIVATYGSSPRPVGSLLALGADGALAGSLSGGCVEDDLVERLRAGDLARRGPERITYGLEPSDTERLGLPCGGTLEVVVERLAGPADAATFATVPGALLERSCVRRDVPLMEGVPSTAERVSTFTGLEIARDAAGRETLHHVYGPRRQLFLIGAGMVSRYLADMAQALEFEVTVCDPRETMTEQWDLPGVRVVRAMPDDAIRDGAKDARTAIVALTHDPRIDDMGLMEALETDAFYVGAMGSRVTSDKRRDRLRALGIDEAALERLHAPVGIAIGSKTPAEIAISILAELTREVRAAERIRAAAAST